ncbi:MAG: hypothetical protein ACI9MU_004299, partial [Alphaproteobacteria bacterium]
MHRPPPPERLARIVCFRNTGLFRRKFLITDVSADQTDQAEHDL